MSGTTGDPAVGFLRRSFKHWSGVAHAIGVVQTRFLMFAVFVVLVVPTGLLMNVFRDPMHLHVRAGSNWTPAASEPPSLEVARRQF
jgi:hypothetical protein